ncbi:MAG TPA: hypothetical protein VM925_20580 [Labilithrix sp.]|jgi:hypothetical protein|nr:hypothetical protein [Labilithrix sp.]
MQFRVISVVASVIATASIFACTTKVVTKASEPSPESDAAAPEPEVEDAGVDEVLEGDAPQCPGVGTPKTTATITAADIAETSGIVSSTFNKGIFWVHNDSGDLARAFAINAAGELVATLAFDDAKPTDIEDIAIEDESPEKSNLYFGDIGDNGEERAELTIHRVTEPKLGPKAGATITATSEKMRVVYSDGPHNAETLLFDPTTKELLIATKKARGPSDIHRIGPFSPGTKVKTKKVASVDIDRATGGDIARDGRYIAIRNYGKNAYLWVREPGESLAVALGRKPCAAPMASEDQGEAFGFLPGATGYVTLSEGASPQLHVASFK